MCQHVAPMWTQVWTLPAIALAVIAAAEIVVGLLA
jgi:hypothetical protein